MSFHYKVVLFVYGIAIFLMAAHDADAQKCANIKEPCDFFPPINKRCCKGTVCSMSFEKWVKNDTSLKGECKIDTYAPTCRAAEQPCGTTVEGEDDMPELSSNNKCCDNLECDLSSQKCVSTEKCRKLDQPCGLGNTVTEILSRTTGNMLLPLSSNTYCCPGLLCGDLGWCFEASKIECIKEGKSCRVYGCCEGLHCNSIGRDHTGEFQYRCQKKTCQTNGSCDVFNNNCCDGHYCYYRFGLLGGLCLLDGTTLHSQKD